jgi:hypothetical protein
MSGDMLDYCRKRAVNEGFSPSLYNQPMHAFQLPRKYKTIYICDSFGLAGSREKDLEALRCCHAHLEDAGALLLNIEAEYNFPASWELWTSDKRKALPQPWPANSPGRVAADGSQHFGLFRIIQLDPLEQSYTRQVHLEKWQSGKLAVTEEYILRGNIYFKNEMLLMLRLAGFREVSVRGGYADEPATPDHEQLVFIAIR